MTNREIIEALIFSSSGAAALKDIMRILPGMSPEEIARCVEELNGIYEDRKSVV